MVAVVLEFSSRAAWVTFLGLTAIVYFFAFRSIFPSRSRYIEEEYEEPGDTVTPMMGDLESMITKGFEERDLKSQKKTFVALQRILALKVRRKCELNEIEFKALIENPNKLEATIGDPSLVQLLSNELNPGVSSWDLERLSNLIDRVDDWGR